MTAMTVEEIQNLSDEDRAALNKKIARTFVKHMLGRIVLTTVVVAGAHYAMQALDSRNATANAETPTI